MSIFLRYYIIGIALAIIFGTIVLKRDDMLSWCSFRHLLCESLYSWYTAYIYFISLFED